MKLPPTTLAALAAAGLLAACSGVSLTGPNVTQLAPAVRGQVVNDATGEPVRGARVGREALPPPASARTETGAQRLAARDHAARTRRDGTFHLPALRSAHLLLGDDRLPNRRLVIEQRGFVLFETNLPRLKGGPAGRVPEMDVGVVRLVPLP